MQEQNKQIDFINDLGSFSVLGINEWIVMNFDKIFKRTLSSR